MPLPAASVNRIWEKCQSCSTYLNVYIIQRNVWLTMQYPLPCLYLTKHKYINNHLHHETGTLFSLAHFFIVRTIYSTWGLPVLRNNCNTSRNVSLIKMKKYDMCFAMKINGKLNNAWKTCSNKTPSYKWYLAKSYILNYAITWLENSS